MKVINANVLDLLPLEKDCKVFSNLPFSITSTFLSQMLDFKTEPTEMYLILQKEAALMFGGKSIGAEKETLKSLSACPFFHFEVLGNLPRTEFKPIPKVDIVFIKITKRTFPLIKPDLLLFRPKPSHKYALKYS